MGLQPSVWFALWIWSENRCLLLQEKPPKQQKNKTNEIFNKEDDSRKQQVMSLS